MSRLFKNVVPSAVLLGMLAAACLAQEAPKEIKVLRVGSSSFPYSIIEIARSVAEEFGRYKIVCDDKADQTGYSRLDQFITQPGLFEEWCEQQVPHIQEGDYDFVVIQTIGWTGMTPEQHERLCTEIIPALVEKITAAGAKVILYDKYIKPELRQKDPRARTWCGRYPEAYKLNYLLHIMAAKNAPGIVGATFGGQAITEKWNEEHYDRLGALFADTSHPGPMANYISALNMAYLLTGEKPVGSAVRQLPLGEGRERWFRRLPTSNKPGAQECFEENKDRVGEGVLTLRDEEAAELQEAAWRSQSEWGTLLNECLADDAKYAEVEKEIRRIQGEMCNYEAWGLDEGTIAALKQRFAPPSAPGELTARAIATMRRKSRSIAYAGADVRNYHAKFLDREKQKEVAQAYADYWHENNSKLRDDIYFGCKVAEAKATKAGDRDEVHRLSTISGALHLVLSFPAYMLLLDNVTDEQKATILKNYRINGGPKRSSPNLSGYLNENHLDEAKLRRAWNIHMNIWSDPDLMDKLRDNNYPLEVITEADEEFARRIAEQENE